MVLTGALSFLVTWLVCVGIGPEDDEVSGCFYTRDDSLTGAGTYTASDRGCEGSSGWQTSGICQFDDLFDAQVFCSTKAGCAAVICSAASRSEALTASSCQPSSGPLEAANGYPGMATWLRERCKNILPEQTTSTMSTTQVATAGGNPWWNPWAGPSSPPPPPPPAPPPKPELLAAPAPAEPREPGSLTETTTTTSTTTMMVAGPAPANAKHTQFQAPGLVSTDQLRKEELEHKQLPGNRELQGGRKALAMILTPFFWLLLGRTGAKLVNVICSPEEKDHQMPLLVFGIVMSITVIGLFPHCSLIRVKLTKMLYSRARQTFSMRREFSQG